HDVGLNILKLLLLVPRLGAGHDYIGDDEAARVAPLGMDGIISDRHALARIDDMPDGKSNDIARRLASEQERLCDIISPLRNILVGEDASADDRVLVRLLVLEQVYVEFEEGGEGLCNPAVRDLGGVQLV